MALPHLKTKSDIESLMAKLSSEPTIALWATDDGKISSVDTILRLYGELQMRGKQVILLLRKNCSKFFPSIEKNKQNKLIYIFDDLPLLYQYHFIDLLVTHDYCINAELEKFLSEFLAEFQGKTLLLQHNMLTTVPCNVNWWADYALVSMSNINYSFDYTRIPNSKKIGKMPFLSIIPSGYPKIEMLIKAQKRIGNTSHKLVSFYPHKFWYRIGNNPFKIANAISQWRELITLFFEKYPDWRFVFRPNILEREHLIVKELAETFANQTGFIIDYGNDSKKYIIESDVLITNGSTLRDSFPFATLRPAIVMSITNQHRPTFSRNETTYYADSALQAIQAITDALENKIAWEERILKERNRVMPNVENVYAHIADSIDKIISSEQDGDWIRIDKGNTPYEKESEWLNLFAGEKLHYSTTDPSKFVMAQVHQYSPFRSYLASMDSHPNNQKIALAFFRLVLNNLLPFHDGIPPERNSEELNETLYYHFDFLPPKCILDALQDILKKTPDNIHARIWYMRALVSFKDTTGLEEEEYNKELIFQIGYLQGKRLQSFILLQIVWHYISPAITDYYNETQDWRPLLTLLEAALDENTFKKFPQATFLYILLLLQAKRFDYAINIFYKWDLTSKTDKTGETGKTDEIPKTERENTYQEHYNLAKRFVEYAEQVGQLEQVEQANTSLLPEFFSKNGMAWQNICGVDMAFVNRKNFTAWFDISKWLSLMESMKKNANITNIL